MARGMGPPKCGVCKLRIDPTKPGRDGQCHYYKNKYYHLDCTPDFIYEDRVLCARCGKEYRTKVGHECNSSTKP